jgi:transposase
MDLSEFELAKRRKRRVWSDDEKRMICAQTRVPGVSVSQVARRYDVNANQVFNWLKDPRFSSDEDAEGQACFLPVEITEDVRHEDEPPLWQAAGLSLILLAGIGSRSAGLTIRMPLPV